MTLYLRSVYGTFQEKREGIYIGAGVAPILSDLFLSTVDRKASISLEGTNVTHIFHYVDAFLVLNEGDQAGTAGLVMQVFTTCDFGLRFTTEMPNKGVLQFLDLSLLFFPGHVCWMYGPRENKGILTFESNHSKLVKRAVVTSATRADAEKFCSHRMVESLDGQESRLRAARFPSNVIVYERWNP